MPFLQMTIVFNKLLYGFICYFSYTNFAKYFHSVNAVFAKLFFFIYLWQI